MLASLEERWGDWEGALRRQKLGRIKEKARRC